jgi:carbon monoxide dehydrogenase subunit G
MTARVERTFELSAPVEEVWAFISDPGKRASAISLVESYEVEGDRATWRVRIPIPMVSRTVAVQTRDLESDPPSYVKFVGTSSVLRVVGEHELEPTDEGGTRLTNRFVVEGKLPGVEGFFERNLDEELDNLERRLREATA